MLLSANAFITKCDELARLGYGAIDVGLTRVIYNNDPYPHDPMLDGDDWRDALDGYIKRCRELGLKIGTTHIPYRYDYTDTANEKFPFYHKMTVRALQASEYLGAEWTVLHVRDVKGTVEYAKKLFVDSGVKSIGIAIENMGDLPIDELIEAHDILKAEGYNVGICLDIGHCHLNGHYINDVPEVILRLGERIKMLHVHDNSRGPDMHKAPYMGTIPWAKVMAALKKAGYTGDLNLELQPELIPEPAREAYERYSVDIGNYLISLYENA